MSSSPHILEPIGYIETPFEEKFGVPRQAGLSPAAIGMLRLIAPFNRSESLRGLASFSHVWLIWKFHENEEAGWKPTVRPPRLGGNERRGVFATRSSFRPNALGLSVAKLLKVDEEGCVLTLGGVDLVNATPIYDIKPYLPYADAITDASSQFAEFAPTAQRTISWADTAVERLYELPEGPRHRKLIEECLALDPRPAFHDDPNRRYHLRIAGMEITWENTSSTNIHVVGVRGVGSEVG